MTYFRRVAEQGGALAFLAQYAVGEFYDLGRGVPQDFTEAANWYRKAAEQGHDEAQNRLGLMQLDGLGVDKDVIEAHKWFNLAAASTSFERHRQYAANRDRAARMLPPEEVAEAQKRAREWLEKFKTGSETVIETQASNTAPIPGSGAVTFPNTSVFPAVLKKGEAIRVGGRIVPPTKIKDVKPVYPSIAQSALVQGEVVIEATIGSNGKVTNAVVIRSIPLLDGAALDAVRQWEYSPTLVDGVAVPVIMTTTVTFSLNLKKR